MGCYANKKETIGKGGPLKVVYRQNLTLPNATKRCSTLAKFFPGTSEG